MSVSEMLPAIRALPRPDKFWLAQMLLADLAKEEGTLSLEAELVAGSSHPIWSQYDAYDAVPILMQALENARKKS
jgi:hypothetical protein